ncbi:MAG: hypothetical protein ACJ8FY_13945 [Gemmataceae bacterium]
MLKQLSVSLLAVGVICCIVDTWASSEITDAHYFESLTSFAVSADELAKANADCQRLDEEYEAHRFLVEAREIALQDLRLQRRSLIEVATSFRKAVVQYYPKFLPQLRRNSPRKSDLEHIANNLVLVLHNRLENEKPPSYSDHVIRELQCLLADSAFIRSCQLAGTGTIAE